MRLARLTQRREFLAAAEHGRRFRSSAFTVQVLDRQVLDRQVLDRPACEADTVSGLRLGLTASRKVGGSVQRNRIRRRLREAAKAALQAQAGRACDIVIVARTETLTADFKVLVGELSVAIDRARPSRQGRKPHADERGTGQGDSAKTQS